MAQQFDHAGVAAGRDDIGVDRVAGCCFQQQEGADDDDQQHEDAADEAAAEEGEGAGHGETWRRIDEGSAALYGTPLCPAGHLPRKGGDRMSSAISPIFNVSSE